ncbi:MAG: hypothetical protein ACLFSQ_12670 [Candidatus Zixiibacteriota bacterium]
MTLKRVMISILLMAILSTTFAQPADYAERKARMAPPPNPAKPTIGVHNDDVAVQVNTEDGKYNEGTYPDSDRLLYSYPSSPWSSWTMVKVDGVDYCNSSGTEVRDLPITTDFTEVSHSGDSSYIWGGYSAEDVEIYQKLQPVYITYPDTVIGTVFIEYTIVNTDATAHNVQLMIEMDTMIGSNDAADLATSRGYSGVEEGFRSDDSLGMPPFWLAYEEGPDYTGDQLIGLGILTGWDAVTPDVFMVGQWGSLYSTTWAYTPSGTPYSDSAVRIYWDCGRLEAGDTAVVSTYYGLGKELRMGQIILYPEPVTVTSCTFSPNPFNVLLLFNNSTAMPVSDLTAEIILPEGFELSSGELVQPLTPSYLSSSESGTSNWDISITPPIPEDDTIWFRVDSPDLDSASVAYHVMDLPEIGLPPYADVEAMEPMDMTVSACEDQNLYISFFAENSVREESVEFYVNSDTMDLTDPRLEYSGDSLVFTPDTPFESGDYIEYGIVDAIDSLGCTLAAPATAAFVYDIEPPFAHTEMPEDSAILGTTDIEELTINIEDAVQEVDTATISLEVNGTVYDWGHEALSFEDNVLHFNIEAAGMEIEDGDTVNVSLLPVSDMSPDYCDANTMAESYDWSFRVNIIDLWLPDTFAYPGDTVYIDIWVEDLRNMGITNFDIDVSYFASVLEVLDVHTRGMTSGWDLSWTDVDGIVSVSGAGPELDTGGKLFKIIAIVNSHAAGAYSRLEFDRADFNDGEYTSLPVDGFLEVRWTDFNFLGNLRFDAATNDEHTAIAFGANTDATNDYDPGLDLITLPYVPGDITAYFDVDDPEYPSYDRLRRDMRYWGEYPIEWTGHAEYGGETDTTVVTWSPDHLPPGLFVIRYETYDGDVVSLNMHSNSQFKFTREIDFTITYDHPELVRNTIELCPGWNLISLPNMPSSEISINELFPTSMASAYRYDPIERRYAEFREPEVGVGFWLFSAEHDEVEVAGAQIDHVDMPIYRGWNTIGMPSLSSTSATISTNPPGLFSEDFIYYYDACGSGTYIAPEGEFHSGKGYFLLVPEDGTLNIEDE